MAHKVSTGTTSDTASIFYLIGGAALFICVAWLLQAMTFTGSGAETASVLWTLMAAGVAGLGTGLIYAVRSVGRSNA